MNVLRMKNKLTRDVCRSFAKKYVRPLIKLPRYRVIGSIISKSRTLVRGKSGNRYKFGDVEQINPLINT